MWKMSKKSLVAGNLTSIRKKNGTGGWNRYYSKNRNSKWWLWHDFIVVLKELVIWNCVVHCAELVRAILEGHRQFYPLNIFYPGVWHYLNTSSYKDMCDNINCRVGLNFKSSWMQIWACASTCIAFFNGLTFSNNWRKSLLHIAAGFVVVYCYMELRLLSVL